MNDEPEERLMAKAAITVSPAPESVKDLTGGSGNHLQRFAGFRQEHAFRAQCYGKFTGRKVFKNLSHNFIFGEGSMGESRAACQLQSLISIGGQQIGAPNSQANDWVWDQQPKKTNWSEAMQSIRWRQNPCRNRK